MIWVRGEGLAVRAGKWKGSAERGGTGGCKGRQGRQVKAMGLMHMVDCYCAGMHALTKHWGGESGVYALWGDLPAWEAPLGAPATLPPPRVAPTSVAEGHLGYSC